MAFCLSKIVLLLLRISALASATSLWEAVQQNNLQSTLGAGQNYVNSLNPTTNANKMFNGVYFDPDLVGFYLYYDPANLNANNNIVIGNAASIKNSHFDPQKTTKILIHGFTQNGTSSFPENVKNAYLNHTGTQFNIIVVDWGKLSSPKYLYPLFYNLAYTNVPAVGVRVGQFIMFLKQNNYTSEAQVHLVGFSLGAHVASNAAYYVQNQSGVKLARISGLDPAGPGYEIGQPLVKRLNPSDAEFVDVIHGNAGELGLPGPIGHVDFYPNGGSIQPTCGVEAGAITTFLDSLTGLLSGSCSHGKAPVYFGMSLDPAQIGNIVGCQCASYLTYKLTCEQNCNVQSVFGEYISTTTRGEYYLNIIPVEDQ